MNFNSSIGSNIQVTQYIAIAASIGLFIYITYLVRNKRIKEEYSLLWIFFSIVFIFFSAWRDGLEYFARLIGIAYPPAALFIILLLAIFLILIEFSRIISRLTDRNITLAQEIGILKMEVEKLKKGREVKIQGEEAGSKPEVSEK
jgi:hypothetical protein